MENELLKKIKQEYKDIRAALDSNFREISKLESNQIVKRYNYLKYLRTKKENGEFNNSKNILDYCFEHYGYGKVRNTNEIWLLMFECPISVFEKRFNVRLLEEDKSKIVAYYTDIENAAKHTIVTKDNQEEFERTHKVITGKTVYIFDSYGRYYDIRHEFFTSCVEDGQENAVKKILEKYPKIK